MIRSILVPLDGSSFGEHALPLAADLARRANATLHLVHVHQMIPLTALGDAVILDAVEIHHRQDELAYLADVGRRLKEVAPVMVKPAVLEERDVEVALREYVKHNAIDLVVMSTHGRGVLGRFWFGGVADALLREVNQPMLLVRPSEGKPDLRRKVDLHRIVVPLDGTPYAERIMEPVVEMGRLFESRMTLMRVIPPVLRASCLPDATTMQGLANSALEEVQKAQRRLQEEADAYLKGFATMLREKGIKEVETRVMIDEEPAAAILDEAREEHSDLIALETHARNEFSRLFHRSVTETIIRNGELVLVHHKV